MEAHSKQKVALVAGVTGIVGNSLAELLTRKGPGGGFVIPQPKDGTPVAYPPWKVYGIGRRPKPDWLSAPVEYIQCDLLNKEETSSKVGPLHDVTHLFWVTWVSKNTESENREANSAMFLNCIDALLQQPNPALEHICLQTGSKHYLGSFESFGKVQIPDAPFHERLPRLPVENFYYDLEEILFGTTKKKEGLTWSIHRPNGIFGFAPRNQMNAIGAMCAYAAICKHEGLPFEFPGNKNAWQVLQDVSDAELIAEQEIWAALNPRAKNQEFNVTNGDVFKWKHLWTVLAEKFGMEAAPYSGGFNLEEKMKNKGPVWDEIVSRNSLHPTKLEEVGQFWFIDKFFNMGPEPVVLSMNKSKEFGFFGYRNTEKSLRYWIDKLKEHKIVP